MVRFEDLKIFLAAVDQGSFSAAARELDLTPAAASAAVKRLEQALDARLFVRSTRSLRLTGDGERYLEYARSSISTLEAGKNAVARSKTEISGTLSVSIPSDLGRHVLLPWLDAFQEQHPRVGFQVRISDRLADLYRQPVDLAVRYGTPTDSGLVALPLAEHNRRVVCASPAYFARHGMPQAPADLRRHNCLSFVLGETLHDRWTFLRADGSTLTVPVKGDRVGDDGELVRRWALAGQGVAYKSRYDVLSDLRAGRLVEALGDYASEPSPLYLLCVHRMLLSPAVRRLREFLQERFRQFEAG
ncbi:LysR family transcriptional regulator [Achromobacter denitrificans]|uniref:LysR family transcriptional regulator n=2 Tax=Achromobacter denitrificans TaxID=32002 RepID=A0A6N0JHQ2_ACHDE|nr:MULTISPECIES: LysR family transcriptional regulator [Achromobacter]ASC66552.1 LysR family transcriptional regulator [Achromobacter denitrificans]MBV2160501.1 LysR family transcriptional regulator [Achromobacter denitrificans]MDF3850650.1 LysR family transcriptional regulator [Achromobacter denitrificans]MDX3877521.1 LysR family transcriptional regulator [Achromobacter sp.]MPT37305.1 LysR family transcriptional regulator [Achromobacter sp.]